MNFESMMLQLRSDYISSLPEKVQIIRHFYNSGDALGVREVFHKLKGTGSTYGVPEISEIGETLEQFCKKNPTRLQEAIPEALELLHRVHTARSQDKAYDVKADKGFAKIKLLT